MDFKKIGLFLSAAVLFSFACSALSEVDRVMFSKAVENEGSEVEFFPEDPGVPDPEDRCSEFQIIESDIRGNEDLYPEIAVFANGEAYPPPEGFELSYPPAPGSHPLNQWRLISQHGGTITVKTSQPVACAGIFLIGDYISPAEVEIDGELVWEGYLYPGADPHPTKFFYLNFPVKPPHSVTISIIGLSPHTDSAAYVPVYMFGFELP